MSGTGCIFFQGCQVSNCGKAQVIVETPFQEAFQAGG
jgi:hypothetical protein